MMDNIEKVLERGDRLALLVDKTTNIQGNAVRFRDNHVATEIPCGGETLNSRKYL